MRIHSGLQRVRAAIFSAFSPKLPAAAILPLAYRPEFSYFETSMNWGKKDIPSNKTKEQMVMSLYYEAVMTTGYASRFLARGMVLEQAKISAVPFVSQSLYLFPAGSALFQVIQGFMSDKLGRKPTVMFMCGVSVSLFLLFYLGANGGWNPYLIGFFCGGAVGSYFAAGDLSGGIMCPESSPTNLRASVTGVQPLLSGVFGMVAIFGSMGLINWLGDSCAGVISLGFAVPGMLTGLLIISKARETKNVKLDEITGREDNT